MHMHPLIAWRKIDKEGQLVTDQIQLSSDWQLLLTNITPGVLTQLLKMAIYFFDLPIKNSDFQQLCDSLPEGTPKKLGFTKNIK